MYFIWLMRDLRFTHWILLGGFSYDAAILNTILTENQKNKHKKGVVTESQRPSKKPDKYSYNLN